MDDGWQFGWLVVQHWVSLLTGSIVTAILLLIDKLTNWRLPKWVYVLVVTGTLVVAAFQAWYDERTRATNAETRANNLQAALDAKPRPPQLKFYCGDAEIGVDGKKEFKLPWISGSNIYGPNIWVVNVGGSDAKDVHGQTYISERGFYHLYPNPGDSEYPTMSEWQIGVLHAMEGQPAGALSAGHPKPIERLRIKLEARYDGPTAVAMFTVRLFPVAGPTYDNSSLPCARPSFLRLRSSVPQ